MYRRIWILLYILTAAGWENTVTVTVMRSNIW